MLRCSYQVKNEVNGMTFLQNFLGLSVQYKDDPVPGLPYYLLDRYRIQFVDLNSVHTVFVTPVPPTDPVNVVKKHIRLISDRLRVPAVLILSRITSHQKDALVREYVPFVVENRQIYLPFLAVYLQNRFDCEKPSPETILPSSQLLLLHFIYHGCTDLLTSEAALALQLTPTSLSRASKQLEEMGLIQTKKEGVQKIIHSDKSPKDLFLQAAPFLRNPVKRKVYVPKSVLGSEQLLSGYSALSQYTMLASPELECRAVNHLSLWNHALSYQLQDSEGQCQLELWIYDPKILSQSGCVDRLSLALSLKSDGDERVEEALETMLDTIWKNQNGTRFAELSQKNV